MLSEYGIFATSDELAETEAMIKHSNLEWVRTEKWSPFKRGLYGVPMEAPDLYTIIVNCDESQFSDFVNGIKDLTRLF